MIGGAASSSPQAGPAWLRSRPSHLLRLAFRVPIALYRLHLGWLLGHRFVLVTHCGRKTGRLRRTALEVVRFDAVSRECIVVSAWGEKADWYQNLRASPAAEIQISRQRYAPIQRFLTPDEVYAEIQDYERRHPWLIRIIARWLGFPLGRSEAARRTFAASLRMVAFRPSAKTSDS